LIPTSDEGKLGGVGNMTQSATTLYFTKSFQFQNQLPEANVSRPFAGGFERKKHQRAPFTGPFERYVALKIQRSMFAKPF
jgi:hypothetical protein